MPTPTRRAYIEPLESRIAPALLVNGANLLGGQNGPTTGETSVGGNALTLVKVTSGEAIVWYFDGNIESISFGPNTNLTVFGSVQGDIVGNLLANGRLSDTDHNPLNGEDGNVLLPNNLIGLTAIPLQGTPEVIGNIITGGSVSNVNVGGQIGGIYAGDGVFNAASKLIDSHNVVTSSLGPLEYNPFDPSQTAFHFSQLPGLQPTASISNLNLTTVQNFQAIAGSGNPNHLDLSNVAGQAGGSISNVTIGSALISIPAGAKNAPPSYELLAGDGASGAKGGAGGSINNVIEHSSSGQVIIQAGKGGNGGKIAGGNGGSVTNLDLESSSSQYSIFGGNGGSGAPGGVGGSTIGNSFANNTPAGGVIVAADFTGDGADDILIADQGTGNMVLEANNGKGTNFTSVDQTGTSGPPTLIAAPAGSETPIAAAAVAGSGPLPDILVAYQGSNNLVYFHNQGTAIPQTSPTQYENAGDFWNSSLNEGVGGFDTISVPLSFAPSEMAVLNGAGTEVALASNANGKSTIHLVAPTIGDEPAEVSGEAALPAPCVGLVAGSDGTVFAALANGSIYSLSVLGLIDQPFNPPVLQSSAHVIGGISQFSVDSAGTHLLALAANGKALYTFNESGGSLTAGPSVNLSSLGATPDVAHFYSSGTNESIALLSSRATVSQINLYSLTEDTNSAGSPITTITPQTPPLTTDNALHNFTVANSGANGPGFAGLQGALGQFTFDLDFTPIFTNFALPFASKTILVQAGNGGGGIDVSSTKFGIGGAGGNVSGINADAETINLVAGNGGDAEHGGGGDGGSITNPKKITTHGTGTVATAINASGALTITAGAGGSPLDPGAKQAFGGDGGSVDGFTANLKAGQNDILMTITAGDGGDGQGGAGGSGGSVSNLQTTGADGSLVVIAGQGGSAKMGATSASGNGGNAGSISNFSYTLSLSNQTAAIEKPHDATLTTQDGGTSIAGVGGAGGSVSNATLQMQSANVSFDAPGSNNDSQLDSTVTVTVTTGDGGMGTKGGAGGSVTGFQYGTTITQITPSGLVIAPFVVLEIATGKGGTGTTANGGAGGNISFSKPISGVTYMDQDEATPTSNPDRIPLFVVAGDGGDGATFGGNGGSISGLTAQNSPFTAAATGSTGSGSGSTSSGGSQGNNNNSTATDVIETTLLAGAVVAAGNGGTGGTGNGGAGGSISNSLIGVETGLYEQPGTGSRSSTPNTNPLFFEIQGFLDVTGGNGGNGGTAGGTSATAAKGGAGGAITNVNFGLVSTTEDVGMTILGGDGGTGVAAGGAGGGLSSVTLSVTENTQVDTAPSAVLVAGNGGDVNSVAGVGGAGGNITKVSDNKDENSAISLIQAGNGGNNLLGKAGNGGNISNIDTVGFIGRPSDASGPLGVFDLIGSQPFAQGLYSGRGGVGVTNGVNGSIINVIARQIAAMSAAEDPNSGTFAAASKISNVSADLIGYDIYRGTGNAREGVYTDSNGGSSSPSSVTPLDGFILGTVITNVTGEQTGFVFTS